MAEVSNREGYWEKTLEFSLARFFRWSYVQYKSILALKRFMNASETMTMAPKKMLMHVRIMEIVVSSHHTN